MDEGLAGLAAGYAFDVPAVGLGRAVRGEEVNTIHARYGQTVDPDSANERLTARLQQAEADKPIPAPGGVDTHDLIQMGKMALRFMSTPAGREIQRSIFGVLRRRR